MLALLADNLRRHAVAYLALFVALGGTSYAVSSLPANSVGTAQLRPGAVLAQDVGRLPAVKAFTTDPEQQLSDGTFAAVRLKQEEFDTARMHDPEADTRIVAPRSGTYVVQATAVFSGGACGGPPRVALIQKHLRSGGLATVDNTSSGTMCNEPTRVHAGAIVRMRAGEHLELMALQRSSPQVGVAGAMSAAYVGG
ncbi:MAG TPA: hypothetical protein VF712_07295 [Thermoleophilaceae bacterium]|jgi:hypothetical protein